MTLPGRARDLRVDPFGRYVLVRAATGDSAWIVSIGADKVVGTLHSAWRGDLPFVAPDGAIAVHRGRRRRVRRSGRRAKLNRAQRRRGGLLVSVHVERASARAARRLDVVGVADVVATATRAPLRIPPTVADGARPSTADGGRTRRRSGSPSRSRRCSTKRRRASWPRKSSVDGKTARVVTGGERRHGGLPRRARAITRRATKPSASAARRRKTY